MRPIHALIAMAGLALLVPAAAEAKGGGYHGGGKGGGARVGGGGGARSAPSRASAPARSSPGPRASSAPRSAPRSAPSFRSSPSRSGGSFRGQPVSRSGQGSPRYTSSPRTSYAPSGDGFLGRTARRAEPRPAPTRTSAPTTRRAGASAAPASRTPAARSGATRVGTAGTPRQGADGFLGRTASAAAGARTAPTARTGTGPTRTGTPGFLGEAGRRTAAGAGRTGGDGFLRGAGREGTIGRAGGAGDGSRVRGDGWRNGYRVAPEGGARGSGASTQGGYHGDGHHDGGHHHHGHHYHSCYDDWGWGLTFSFGIGWGPYFGVSYYWPYHSWTLGCDYAFFYPAPVAYGYVPYGFYYAYEPIYVTRYETVRETVPVYVYETREVLSEEEIARRAAAGEAGPAAPPAEGEVQVADPAPAAGSPATELNLREASEHFRKKEYYEAAVKFRLAALGSPDLPGPLFALGQSLVALGQDAYAARVVRKAVLRSPKLLEETGDISGVYADAGEFARVLGELEARAKEAPVDGDARFLLGAQRYFAGDPRCREDFDRFHEARPEDEAVNLFRAAVEKRYKAIEDLPPLPPK